MRLKALITFQIKSPSCLCALRSFAQFVVSSEDVHIRDSTFMLVLLYAAPTFDSKVVLLFCVFFFCFVFSCMYAGHSLNGGLNTAPHFSDAMDMAVGNLNFECQYRVNIFLWLLQGEIAAFIL